MDVIKSETRTVYKVQAYQAGHGYAPSWQTCESHEDYDEILVLYDMILKSEATCPLRLISESVNIDVLAEN